MNSGYGSDDSKGRPHPTLYPEVDQVPNFAWSGFGQSNNHPVPALVSQYHQTSAPSSRKYRLIAPYRAPVVSDQQPVSTGYALKPSLPQRELQTSVPPPRARSKRASPQEEEPDFLKDFDPSDEYAALFRLYKFLTYIIATIKNCLTLILITATFNLILQNLKIQFASSDQPKGTIVVKMRLSLEASEIMLQHRPAAVVDQVEAVGEVS